MFGIFIFFMDNIIAIIILTLILYILIVLFSLYNEDLNKILPEPSDEKIGKIVTVEGFDITNTDTTNDLPNKSPETSFCELYSMVPGNLELKCNNFNERSCNIPSCCVWRNGNKCVAGDKLGPTFHGTVESPISTKFYHHKNVCYGLCPAEI